MSHHTHNTPAFVLGAYPSGESSRMLALFTRELGLVYGIARNMRAPQSKLRFHLQPYAQVSISLVRGKEVWRITGATQSKNYYYMLQEVPAKRALLTHMCLLVKRLVQGEEADPALFDLLEQGFHFLAETRLDASVLRNFEYLFVLRTLSHLGYVSEQPELFPEESPFSEEILANFANHQREAVLLINKALEASGL